MHAGVSHAGCPSSATPHPSQPQATRLPSEDDLELRSRHRRMRPAALSQSQGAPRHAATDHSHGAAQRYPSKGPSPRSRPHHTRRLPTSRAPLRTSTGPYHTGAGSLCQRHGRPRPRRADGCPPSASGKIRAPGLRLQRRPPPSTRCEPGGCHPPLVCCLPCSAATRVERYWSPKRTQSRHWDAVSACDDPSAEAARYWASPRKRIRAPF